MSGERTDGGIQSAVREWQRPIQVAGLPGDRQFGLPCFPTGGGKHRREIINADHLLRAEAGQLKA